MIRTIIHRSPLESTRDAPPGDGEGASVEIARVGLEDKSPAFIRLEGEQAWCEVTRRNGEALTVRVADEVRDLAYGDAVILVCIDGDPQKAILTSRVYDRESPMPTSVAGVSTGSAATEKQGVITVAPTWSFMRTRDGRLFALETGVGGDLLLHSGAGVHVKATTTHIEGTVHLGAGPTTPPVGSAVAPGNLETPGVPLVPRVAVPLVNLTTIPYVGDRDGVVRAVDEYESNIAIDPIFWSKMVVGLLALFEAWVLVVPALLPAFNTWKAIPPLPIPTSLTSKAKSASSKVTAAP